MRVLRKLWARINWPESKCDSSREIFLEGIGPVDRSIVPHIKKLNEAGFRSIYSCSGILNEHLTKSGYPYIIGYISFRAIKCTIKYKKIVSAAKDSGFDVDDYDFTKVSIYLPVNLIDLSNDEEKMRYWDNFLDNVTKTK